MKKTEGAMGDMKGKGEEMSSEAKDKDMPEKIEAQGKEKMGKGKKAAKKKAMAK